LCRAGNIIPLKTYILAFILLISSIPFLLHYTYFLFLWSFYSHLQLSGGWLFEILMVLWAFSLFFFIFSFLLPSSLFRSRGLLLHIYLFLALISWLLLAIRWEFCTRSRSHPFFFFCFLKGGGGSLYI